MGFLDCGMSVAERERKRNNYISSYGEHSFASVCKRIDMPTGAARIMSKTFDEGYEGRHRDHGNCHWWWPKTGFIPPHNFRMKRDRAPFRMLRRETWERSSKLGLQPNQYVRNLKPGLAFNAWETGRVLYRDDIKRTGAWDFNTGTTLDYYEIAWRVQDFQNGCQWRVPESMLEILTGQQ